MNNTLSERYLLWYTSRAPAYFGDWFWLTTKFLPTIEKCANDPAKAELISLCYYKVGDIFFFMDAPCESIKYYKLSIKYVATHAAAYREIGDRLLEMQRYKSAEKYLKKAYKLDDSDPYTQASLSFLQDQSYQNSDEPDSPEERTHQKCAELLAQGQSSKVLKRMSKPQCVKDRQFRARAYGEQRNKTAFIDEWAAMLSYDEKVEMCSADWFYMPYSVWNDARFWTVLLQMHGRFLHGNYPYHESLWKSVVPQTGIKDDATDLLLHNKRVKLFALYHIARLTHDRKLSEHLADAYPDWPEVQKLFKRLRKNS